MKSLRPRERLPFTCPVLSLGASFGNNLPAKFFSFRHHEPSWKGLLVLSWFDKARKNIYSRLCGSRSIYAQDTYLNGRLDAYRRNLVADMSHPYGDGQWFRVERLGGNRQNEFEEQCDAFQTLLRDVSERKEDLVWDPHEPKTIENARRFTSALDRFSSWTVFRTRIGSIGRGPPLLQTGDRVCIFMGSRTPFVVRKTSVAFGLLVAHQLVGECYVHGLMDKEILKKDSSHWASLLIF